VSKRTLVIIAVLALLAWCLLKKKSAAAQLAEDVARDQPPQVPTFGTDAIIDAADATAVLHLQVPAPIDYSKYIGKIS
jgi:hypothetical protein